MNPTVSVTSSIQKKPTSKLAIASLIFGVLSLLAEFLAPPSTPTDPIYWRIVSWVPALIISVMVVIFGAISIFKIVKYKSYKGKEWAIVGMVMGGLILVQLIMTLIFYIAF